MLINTPRVALIYLVLSFYPFNTFACVVKQTPIEAFFKSSLVFSGAVENISCKTDFSKKEWDIAVSFEVKEIWKGANLKKVRLYHSFSESAHKTCPINRVLFEKGKHYFVYARERNDGLYESIPWGKGACGRTAQIANAAEDFRILSEPTYMFKDIVNNKKLIVME